MVKSLENYEKATLMEYTENDETKLVFYNPGNTEIKEKIEKKRYNHTIPDFWNSPFLYFGNRGNRGTKLHHFRLEPSPMNTKQRVKKQNGAFRNFLAGVIGSTCGKVLIFHL